MSEPDPPPSPDETPAPPSSRTVIMGGKANPNAKAKSRKPPAPDPAPAPPDGDMEEDDEFEEGPPVLKARSGGGPGSSILNWFGMGVIIRLFRLSVKLIPIAFALAAAGYGYTYFFGAIPIVESIKSQLGLTVAQQPPQASRVDQMLQKTRDSIAASDSRVHLGNAIASGDIETADAIETGQLVVQAPEPTPAPTAKTVVKTPVRKAKGKSESMVSGALDSLVTAFKEATNSDGALVERDPSTSTTGATGASTNSSSDERRTVASNTSTPSRSITVVQDSSSRNRSRYRNINYHTGPGASEEFRKWMQSVQIGRVTKGFRPQVELYNQFFPAGTNIDYAIGITFEGLADDDTVLVFSERGGAYLATKF